MLAILGGLGAAVAFAAATLASTRSSRLIGAASTVAWVMLVGLPFAAVGALLDVRGLTPSAYPWLLMAGLGNVIGLGVEYAALRIGRVGVVAPLVATEGAIAALISIIVGAPLVAGLLPALVLVVVGGALTAASADATEDAEVGSLSRRPVLSAVLGLVAAFAFGLSLYATGRVSQSLPLGWVAVSPRVAGVLLVAAPLIIGNRLRISRSAAPMVVIAGLAEVVGFFCVGLGARSSLAVTSVLTAQFAALAVIGAVFLFGEPLRPVQRAGVVAIAVGTGVIALLRS
jgi:drug/metabolite transporter (DMT)-like permease